MKCKRRLMHGKRRRRSPIQFDFTSSNTEESSTSSNIKESTTPPSESGGSTYSNIGTGRFAPENIEGNFGSQIAEVVTPKSLIDLIPAKKGIDAARAIYNMFT